MLTKEKSEVCKWGRERCEKYSLKKRLLSNIIEQ